MMTFAKRVMWSILYIAFVCFVCVAVVYIFFWRPFVSELRDVNKPASNELSVPRHVNRSVAKRLGSIRTGKKSSFVHFATEKKQGLKRVCAFGDSFTYGQEVSESNDYPSLLQQIFHKKGFNNVEVINFGSPGYGFHRAYVMWNFVGRKFDCDSILLGPSAFSPRRDLTFNRWMLSSPYNLYSRYVIDGHELRLLDPIGDTHEERFAHYFRFIPHWVYVRYDRNLPPPIRSVLPTGRTLKNPLYYRQGPPIQEAFQLYRMFLTKLSENKIPVIVGDMRKKFVEVFRQVKESTISVIHVYTENKFPYLAPKGHFSAIGNRLVAEQFYMELVNQEKRSITVIETEDIEWDASRFDASDTHTVSSYDRVEIELGNMPAGFLVTATTSENPRERGQGSPSALRGSGITSLLAIKDEASSILDACFVPLRLPLYSEADVLLNIAGTLEGEETYLLGKVRLVDSRLNVGEVEVDGMDCNKSGMLAFNGNRQVPIDQLKAMGNSFTVLVNSEPVLKGSLGKFGVVLSPVGDVFRRFRVGRSYFADIDELDTADVFNLVVVHPDDGLIRAPIAKWKKAVIDISELAE